MKRIGITPIKRTLKARIGTSHHGDYVLASKDEMIAITGDEPNINRKHQHPQFPSGTQFAFAFFTLIRGKKRGFLIYDYAQYFPIKGPEWIHWKIDASSKMTSKEIKLHVEELLYALRRSKKTPKLKKEWTKT